MLLLMSTEVNFKKLKISENKVSILVSILRMEAKNSQEYLNNNNKTQRGHDQTVRLMTELKY